jgi:hypothetical protein
LVGYRHDGEVSPPGFFGWFDGRFRCGCGRLDLRCGVGAKQPEDSRNPALDPCDQIGKRLSFRCQKKFVELALGGADFVEQLTQLSLDQIGPLRRRLRDHDRLELLDRRQQLLGVGVPIPPRIFSEESTAAFARRKRLAESLVVVLVRRAGQRARLRGGFDRHGQSLLSRLSIMRIDSASALRPSRFDGRAER